MDALIATFREQTAAAKPADSGTPRTYEWAARAFAEFAQAAGLTIETVGPLQFASFPAYLQQKGWTPNAIRTAVKGSRAFLRWAADRGLRDSTDLGRPPLPPLAERQPVHMNRENLVRYLAVVTEQPEPVRTILLLLPMTGCRVRELCGAPLNGIGATDGAPVIRVRRKGSALSFAQVAAFSSSECVENLSAVGLNPTAYATLHSYLRRYRVPLAVESPWLFPSPSYPVTFYTPQQVRTTLRGMRDGLGMPWLTPHKAGRHTLAMLLREEGLSIEQIADALGHESVETTRRIYARASPAEVAQLSGSVFGDGEV